LYKIDEQRNANLSAGISYSGSDGLAFNLGADLKNYLGTGKDINFLFNHGKTVQTYSLGYSDAYFTNSGIGFGGNLYTQKTRLSKTSNVFNYALDKTGMNLVWQFRITKYNYFKLGGGYDYSVVKTNYQFAPFEARNFLKSYNDTLGPRTENTSEGFKEGHLNMGWIHNSLNSYLFPTRGLSATADFKWSVPGGDIEMYRIDLATSWFKTIFDPIVLNLRADIGYADVYNDKPFPFFQNYFLGGGETLRGFKERSLGPRDSNGNPYGGNAVFEGRAQFLFPPPFIPDEVSQAMRLALFLDAGQVYDTHNKEDLMGNKRFRGFSGFRYTAGVSLTWNTPMQVPIAFSFAWPLNKKVGDLTETFAFSMGTGF